MKGRKATAYVSTYDADNLGHTSIYVEGPDGETFERSFFPSTRNNELALHQASGGNIPVQGFVTEGMSQDVRFEGAAPVSVQKIEGLDYDAMIKENQDFNARVKQGQHAFSIRYNGFFVPTLFKAVKRRLTTSTSDIVPPLDDTIPDGLVTNSAERDLPTISVGNCTDAVQRTLNAGGFELKQSAYNYFCSLFARGLTPTRYQKDLTLSGAQEIQNIQELPKPIQEAISKGETIQELRNKEKKPDSQFDFDSTIRNSNK